MKGVFTTGTDTNIGKTWIGVRLISELYAQGFDVMPRKPVESGWNSNIIMTDAWQLASAANKLNQLNSICPNRFKQAISPARAAIMNSQQLTIQQLAKQCTYPQKENDFIYIEGAGGFYSPLTQDGLNSDLAEYLKLPLLLIAENRLGCINQVLLSVAAIENSELDLVAIVLNQTTNNESDLIANQIEIQSYFTYPVFSVAHEEKNTKVIKQLVKLITLK